jgi:hypothetical protein
VGKPQVPEGFIELGRFQQEFAPLGPVCKLQLLHGVGLNHQRAAGLQRRLHLREEIPLEVEEAEDNVELLVRERVAFQVGFNDVELNTFLFGAGARLGDAGGRLLDAGDSEPVLRQEDGVAPFAHGEVEGGPAGELGEVLAQEGHRFVAGPVARLAVARLPVGLVGAARLPALFG